MALIKCPECGKEVSDKAAACPNCGHPIAKETNNGNTQSSIPEPRVYAPQEKKAKKPLKKGDKVLISIIAAACVLIVIGVFIAVSGGSDNASVSPKGNDTQKVTTKEGAIAKKEEPTGKEYISEDQISQLFSSPKDLKGKYVKLTGKIFTTPETKDNVTALQIHHNTTDYSQNFIVKIENPTATYNDGDYVIVDGKIKGTYKGTNLMGASLEVPLIEADTVEVSTYMDIVVPTKNEVSYNAPIDQNGVVVSLDKIQFADTETRIYITVTNNSDSKFYIYDYSAKVTQGTQQYETDSASQSIFEGDYPRISDDILPGVTSSGIIVFPPFDDSTDFQLHLEGHSDDFNLDFNPYVFNCTLKQ